ncbi:MAG: LysM peptidoglycan-binding domain-containing protein [Caldilineaceae bacterium]
MALDKATLINLETQEAIPVMFNPEEYTLEQGNSIAEIGVPGLEKSPIQYVRGNIRTLQMELFFDTYELQHDTRLRDVRNHTGRITRLMEKDSITQAPPLLLFAWGTFQFKCVLESASQRFIMFARDGTPVRARLTVTLKEYEQIEVEIAQGLFIGPPSVRNLLEGETLAKLAYEYLGDPGAWREIAELNGIDDPINLTIGMPLIIPPSKTKTRN